MIEKILLDGILDDTFKKKVENMSRPCLRESREKLKCQKCYDMCPEKAISLTPNGVKIDSILCTGCNLCVSICYSQSLTSPKKPYLSIANKLADESDIFIGCKKTRGEVDVNFGCLKTIDPRFLMALAFADLERKIHIDFSECENCEYVKLGYPTDKLLNFIEENGELNKLFFERGKIIPIEEKELSRRDFLNSIFKKTQNYTKSTIREKSKNLGFDLDDKENADYINKILLKQGFLKNRDSHFMKDNIFSISVDDKCSLCNECVSYCPRNALSIERERFSESLIIDLELCNFCGRCLEKCPENAMTKVKLNKLNREVIFKKEKSFCKSCKTITTNLNIECVCPTCELRRKNRRRTINRG